MANLDIYCTTIRYFSVIDKLPPYIKPLGLGNVDYPEDWLTEKKGNNISALNKYYGEASGFYWIWKNKLKGLNVDEKKIVWIDAIINSMTNYERLNPSSINGSRRKRIALGSGRNVQEVNQLLKQFDQMKNMIKKMNKKGMNKFPLT